MRWSLNEIVVESSRVECELCSGDCRGDGTECKQQDVRVDVCDVHVAVAVAVVVVVVVDVCVCCYCACGGCCCRGHGQCCDCLVCFEAVVSPLLCAQCECFALEHNDFVALIHRPPWKSRPVQFLRFSNNHAKLKIITRNYGMSPEKTSVRNRKISNSL